MSNIPVLIVGAGPTGLLMACELARRGIVFRIIDKNPEQTLTNNATWIQTLTLEMFNEMGLVEAFLHAGNICKSIDLYSQGIPLVKIPFNQLDSLYQYVLMLPQSETERILKNRLEENKQVIERPIELISARPSGNIVEATLRHPDGMIETLMCDWLIACDGANSTVRERCKIYFPGEDIKDQFIVADAHMDSFLHSNELHVFFDTGTVFAALPLGAGKYRLGANLHLDYPRKLYTEKEVKEIVIERAHGNYNVESVSWISPFWIHSKFVETMRQGSIFLAGDAAHVHSPAGGQGMNTGLQDAYNLAWKLALVVKGVAKVSLLDTYQEERLPVIKDIVSRTERFTKLATSENSFIIKLRNFVYKVIHSRFGFSKKFTMRITQLDIQYKNSPIIDYNSSISSQSPKQGKRAPDVKITETNRLHHYLRNNQHNVLLFMGRNPNAETQQKMRELQAWLNEAYSNSIKAHIVTSEKIENVNEVIVDVDSVVHAKYHIKKPAIYIIRPDNYIAYCSNQLDKSAVEKFFSVYFL